MAYWPGPKNTIHLIRFIVYGIIHKITIPIFSKYYQARNAYYTYIGYYRWPVTGVIGVAGVAGVASVTGVIRCG